MQRDSRARLAAILVAVIALALTGDAAWPQSNRTIKIILPFAPGGPAYNAIRILGQQISATGGPTIVVEPHPGAGTAIGTELVATADTRWQHARHHLEFICRCCRKFAS